MKQFVYSPKSLGSALRRQRNLKQLNQKEAGSSFRIEQSTVSSIERGAAGTRLDTLFRMLAALDLEIFIQSKDLTKDKKTEEW